MIWRSRDRDYGSVLLGSADDTRTSRRIRIQILLTGALVVSNLIGALAAVVLTSVGIPQPTVFRGDLWWVNFIVVPIYVVVAFVIGIGLGTIVVVRDLRWSIRGNPPTAREARRTQRVPWRLSLIQAGLWITATALFTTLYGIIEPTLIPKTIFIVGLSGIVVVAITYLIIEFALRPVVAQVISAGYSRRKRSGIRIRGMVSWTVGSAIPIIGIVLVVVFGMIRAETSKLDMVIGVTVLAAIALLTGPLLTWLSSISITGPVGSVRSAMRRLQAGHLDADTEVVVYDGTELGDLQAGFNSMVGGLRERERLQDLFGRHVGRDVAEAALQGDPELGGTEKTVAVVFVDVIGSTTLAAGRPATDVVDILNRFFAVIVRAVEERDGLVNKFEGDAVLAIFGAPIALADPAGAALAAARTIAERLAVEVPDLSAGIGVGYGPVVAGNVGAIERFEYTVIGDPVNESARLSELAKRDPSRPLAAGRAIDATGAEAGHWEQQETITLRGRTATTVVFAARASDDHSRT